MIPTIEPILTALNETPRLLKELLSEIPTEKYKQNIKKGKWSIHEHATHIAEGDLHGFQKRLVRFKNESHPIFEPLSGDNFPKHYFLELDLETAIDKYFEIRSETIKMAYALDKNDWNKEATHPEYKRYTPYIMLRHLLMHDHTHLYQIEDLGCSILH